MAALALISACTSTTPPTSSVAASGNSPTVVVQSPINGAVVPVGQNLTVSGAASDSVGVDHVALFADGVSVASSPSGAPAPLVPFSLTWLATPAGPHALQVIAYRADGTASQPAVVNVVVGSAGSGVPTGSGLFSFPTTSVPPIITPAPTKKPKPSKTPPPATTPPAATPTTSPTPTPTPSLTPDPSGNAPADDDNEPYEIVLTPNNTACPAIDTGWPIAASGCAWEQISGPAGDMTDQFEFKQQRNTTYRMGLTACSPDTSDVTWWSTSDDDTATTSCMDLTNWTSSGGDPGDLNLWVGIESTVQTYNLYQITVWQCQFANCANQ